MDTTDDEAGEPEEQPGVEKPIEEAAKFRSIREWPVDERPRERLLSRGAAALSDAELLAIFLRTGIRGRSAVDLARDLLTEFRGLVGLMGATQAQFCEGKGLGQAKYVQLQAVLEMSSRYLHAVLERGDPLTNPAATRHYLKTRLYNYPHEVFAVLFLDTRNRLIAYEELFHGTIDGASVYPREVVRKALQHNAAAVIFAHNHPSGVTDPSQADARLTIRLREALALLDIRVLDHFIIGDGEPYSLAEKGLI
jgi:DNA repair protein RadC